MTTNTTTSPASRPARPFTALLEKKGSLIIDGAMSTALEALGADLKDDLWTAKVLVNEPQIVGRVHEAYARAGADVAITCSYQATEAGLAKKGLDSEAAFDVIAKSVTLAREGCRRGGREDAIVAGSVGPYGAYLADGSEYRGDYRLTDGEFEAFHALRMDALKAAGCDLYALETQPQFAEIRALVRMTAARGMTCWVTMTHKAGDPTRLPDGTPISEAAAWLDGEDCVEALGFNCIPKGTAAQALDALTGATSKPVILYPNSGETYDAATKTWSKADPHAHDWDADVVRWKGQGVRCLGGCCRTLPEDVRVMRKAFLG